MVSSAAKVIVSGMASLYPAVDDVHSPPASPALLTQTS